MSLESLFLTWFWFDYKGTHPTSQIWSGLTHFTWFSLDTDGLLKQ